MKKILLAVVGLAFAMGFTSGDEDSKCLEQTKQEHLAKQNLQDKERNHRRW